MPKITVVPLFDEWECEDCGTSIAEGYTILKDGVVAVHREPIAHCTAPMHFDGENMLADLCEVFGYDLEIKQDE